MSKEKTTLKQLSNLVIWIRNSIFENYLFLQLCFTYFTAQYSESWWKCLCFLSLIVTIFFSFHMTNWIRFKSKIIFTLCIIFPLLVSTKVNALSGWVKPVSYIFMIIGKDSGANFNKSFIYVLNCKNLTKLGSSKFAEKFLNVCPKSCTRPINVDIRLN